MLIQKQVDMQNVDEPVKTVWSHDSVFSQPGESTITTFQLAQNEFKSHESHLGLFLEDPEPVTFFSLEAVKGPNNDEN